MKRKAIIICIITALIAFSSLLPVIIKYNTSRICRGDDAEKIKEYIYSPSYDFFSEENGYRTVKENENQILKVKEYERKNDDGSVSSVYIQFNHLIGKNQTKKPYFNDSFSKIENGDYRYTLSVGCYLDAILIIEENSLGHADLARAELAVILSQN